jgi:nucleotide-binding universal stress UspA family protein
MTALDPACSTFPRAKRYQHVLLALDGSETAEIALPDAASVAASNGARLTLLHVIPPALAEMYAGSEMIASDQPEGVRRDAAHRYLDSVHRKLEANGIDAQIAVAVGEAAEAILVYADQHGVDLVVMATHGRSGWRRWVLGSVAERVLHAAAGPVLLVRVPPAGGERK